MKCKNNCLGETIIILLIAVIFAGGYIAGRNDSTPRKYSLPVSQWDEVHSYRMCMADRSCRMFIARAKK